MAEKPRFNMTPNAVAKVKELKKKMNVPDNNYFRIGVAGGGCSGFSYKMGFALQETINFLLDHVFDFDGLKIAIDRKSMFFLDGATLDYDDSLNGGFRWINPNAGPSCGCGESFAPKEK